MLDTANTSSSSSGGIDGSVSTSNNDGGSVSVSGGISILTGMDLQAARRQFALIPQDASFFSGSIRFNLDPFNHYR